MSGVEFAADKDIWRVLGDARHFVRIRHCLVRDPNIETKLRKIKEEFKSELEETDDFLRATIKKENNILEMPSRQFKVLAKHLHIKHRSSFDRAIKRILTQIFEMLKTGEAHPSLYVKELEKSDQCYDERSQSEKQFGCFARLKIQAGTVLVQYIGSLRMEELSSTSSSPQNQGSTEDALDQESQELHDQDYCFATGHVDHETEIFIDSKQYGNESAFINDGFADSNSRYIQVIVNGIYCIFCVAMRDIPANDQVTAKYGKRYWMPRDEHAARRLKGGGSQQRVQVLQQRRSSARKRLPPGRYTEASTSDCFPTCTEFLNSYRKGGSWSNYVFQISLEDLCETRTGAAIELPKLDTQVPPEAAEEEDFQRQPKRQKVSERSDKDSIVECDDEEKMIPIEEALKEITMDPMLSDRDQLIALFEDVRSLVQMLFGQDLIENPDSIQGQLLQILKKGKEQLEASEPVSVVLIGDTGVGKSFLINLLLLLSAPVKRAYGLRSILKPALWKELEDLSPRCEQQYPTDILMVKLKSMEAISEICTSMNKSEEEIIDDLYSQTFGKQSVSGCLLRPDLTEDAITKEIEEEDKDLENLICTCESIVKGYKLEYLLPSRSAGGSTTAHIFKVRFGRIVHAVVKFRREEDLREELTRFDWERNFEIDGDGPLLDCMLRKLEVFFALSKWEGVEHFQNASICASLQPFLGKTILICGKGANLRDDRIHVRKQLNSVLFDPEHPDVSLLVSECVVYAPSDLLQGGLEFIDPPGTNDEDPVKYAATSTALINADGVMVLMGSEISSTVLGMLEQGRILQQILFERRGKPIAFVHTCGESKTNNVSNDTLLGRGGKDVKSALTTSVNKTKKLLKDRLGKVFDKHFKNEKLEPDMTGKKVVVIDTAMDAISEQIFSCLPLLWASNLMHSKSQNPECQTISNGGRLIESVLEMRSQIWSKSSANKSADVSEGVVADFVNECNEMLKPEPPGPCIPNQTLVDRVKMFAGRRGRMEPAAEAAFVQDFDRQVYVQLQQKLSEFCSETGFLGTFTNKLVNKISIDDLIKDLQDTITAMKPAVLSNAFQKTLNGNYRKLSLYNIIFDYMVRADSPESCETFRDEMDRMLEEFRETISVFLTNYIWRVTEVQRSVRGGAIAAGNQQEQQALRYAIDEYLSEGRPGGKQIQFEWDASFGKMDAPRAPFGRFGLRKAFDDSCSHSLMQHLLEPAGNVVETCRRQRTDVKQAFQDLITRNLKDLYNGVKEKFHVLMQKELGGRVEKLKKRFLERRVRKGGPISLVHILNNCLNKALKQPPQPSPVRDQTVQDVLTVVRHVRDMVVQHCQHSKEAGAVGGGLSDHLVMKMAKRWQEELEDLHQRNQERINST